MAGPSASSKSLLAPRSGIPPAPSRCPFAGCSHAIQKASSNREYFSTHQAQGAAEIVEDFVKRWLLEVSYEESRAHLGVETQRQWSDLAIERSTPALLGLYSLVTLLGHALHPDGKIPIRQAAWYPKTQATERRCPCHRTSASVGRLDFSDIGDFP
jgi:hypothetical protein